MIWFNIDIPVLSTLHRFSTGVFFFNGYKTYTNKSRILTELQIIVFNFPLGFSTWKSHSYIWSIYLNFSFSSNISPLQKHISPFPFMGTIIYTDILAMWFAPSGPWHMWFPLPDVYTLYHTSFDQFLLILNNSSQIHRSWKVLAEPLR